MSLTLWRHDRSGVDLPGKPAPVPCELATGHPPIPDELPILRWAILDDAGSAAFPPDRVLWWHRTDNHWAAVVRLHQMGHHDGAMALARLLKWCDSEGSKAVADPIVWEIREVPR